MLCPCAVDSDATSVEVRFWRFEEEAEEAEEEEVEWDWVSMDATRTKPSDMREMYTYSMPILVFLC